MEKRLIGRKAVQLQYELIKDYRRTHPAVVDAQGVEHHFFPHAHEKQRQFKLLVSLLVSVQNNDRVTDKVVRAWEAAGLSLEAVREATLEQIQQALAPVNHRIKKSVYIKELAELLAERDVPDELRELLKIRGIGPKIANLYLQIAHGKTVGIAVDTHCHRIPNRLRWVNTRSPGQTQAALEELFDRSEWGSVNKTLVGFGQSVCQAVRPRCGDCPISHLCVAEVNFMRKKLPKPST